MPFTVPEIKEIRLYVYLDDRRNFEHPYSYLLFKKSKLFYARRKALNRFRA